MSLEERLTEFTKKHELDTDAVAELLKIWNVTLVDVAHGLLKETKVQDTPKGKSKAVVKESVEKKWASKAATEFAAEKGLTLDDFTKEKVTKKDIEDYIKAQAKKSGDPSSSKCHGLTKKGDPCNRSGTHKPSGAKHNYCFRHADDFKDYEVSSDSSDDELEPETPIKKSGDELEPENLIKKSDDDSE